MGGIGSGRRWHIGAKSTTDDLRQLDVRRWAREGFLAPGAAFSWRWWRNGETVASIDVRVDPAGVRLIYRSRENGGDWQDLDYLVRLERTPCHYGGTRVWFRCPARGCGRRVALLYGGTIFACRHCYGLAYPVQREDDAFRKARKADKVRRRLGWDAGVFEDFGERPKGMHRRTFDRLASEASALGNASLIAIMAKFR